LKSHAFLFFLMFLGIWAKILVTLTKRMSIKLFKKTIAAFFFVSFMTAIIVHAMETEEAAKTKLVGPEIGMEAPEFELKNLDGETVKLSDFRGKKVMVNFWATWCPPCKKEMPDMQKFYKEHKGDIVILAINIDPESDVSGYAQKLGLHFPILLDKQDVANTTYRILSIPTTFFINEEGIIQFKHYSTMSYQRMKKYLSEM
jgi:peroxiredoxin